MPEKDLVGLC